MALTNCPECKQNISSDVKVCPKCGYILKKSNPFLVAIGWLTLIYIIISLYKCTYDNNYDTKSYGSIDILEHNWCKNEYGSETICGIAINNTGKMCGLAGIDINLYDSAGVQIGTANKYVNNLEAGVKWKFEAHLSGTKAATYKIVNVVCK